MRRLLLTAAVVFHATGCATLVGSSSRVFSIETVPAGATVRINGEVRGVTPLRVKLDPGVEVHRVELELEGHRPWSSIVSRSVNGWYCANIFLNMGLGMIPDAVLGKKYSYSTNDIAVNGETRYSGETRSRCFAGAKLLFDRKMSQWKTRSVPRSSSHYLEEFSVSAELSDLSKIVESSDPVRCQVGEDWFQITPGTKQGGRNLVDLVPIG